MFGKVFRIKSTASLGKHVAIEGILNIDTTSGGYLYLDGSLMSGTEIGFLDGVTAGTVTASKALVVDANKAIGAFCLSNRLTTGTVAGSSVVMDATTWAYSEGLELRYAMNDWADGAVTHTSAKGMYLRMENTEANASGSIYGAEIYGVANNVNTQYVWGTLAYAYVKGTSAKTLTGVYAIQPELTFDAGSGTNTIAEACVVRGKVTGGVMAAYTNLHGYKLIAGDMDGGSRTYGNAFWVIDDADMSGTCGWTVGVNLAANCTTGLKMTGTNTTAIDVDAATTGIDFSGSTGMVQNIILGGNGRVSTGSAAGTSLAIDGTTSQYGEGLELRYHIADWADTYTITDAKGMYLRMENREANSNGSVYGCEVYGVSNDVANTKYIWGGLFYAYLKGTTACTVTGMYALQPELSWDAGAAASTVSEAACVRAKITSGAVAAYTNIHGYKLIAGDMDGGSRTYGNAIWVVDDGDMSGTCSWTKGLYLQATCTTGIDIDNAVMAIDANCTAIGSTGRIAKFYGACANAALTDGYGAVEIDLTISGTNTDAVAATSSWVNILTGTATAATHICAMNNGIYEDSAATITNAKLIFGMRAQKITGDSDALCFPFSINTSNTAITAFVDVNNHSDLGWTTGAASSGGGKFPFMRDINGNILYVNTYTG